LETRVLTGTKAAPVTNPTIEIRWAYSLPITVISQWAVDSAAPYFRTVTDSSNHNVVGYGIDTISVACPSVKDGTNDVSISITVIDAIHKPQINGGSGTDVAVYCK
jgi:hypothetical protein